MRAFLRMSLLLFVGASLSTAAAPMYYLTMPSNGGGNAPFSGTFGTAGNAPGDTASTGGGSPATFQSSNGTYSLTSALLFTPIRDYN